MISDARSVHDRRTLEADVCIVGTGPAGITLAREFIGRKIDVCVLESGGLEPDPEVQSMCEGELTGLPYDPLWSVRDTHSPYGSLGSTRARRFGGTSSLWNTDVGPGAPGVRLRRLDPGDFESRDWVPYSGWPFGMEELLPFYERTHSIFGLGPLADHPDAWPEEGTRHTFSDSRLFEEKLFQFGPSDLFTRTYRSDIERAERVSVYVHGTVTRLETDRTGEHVTRVRVATLAGSAFFVAAKVVVLAAGGIENARLLLVSDGVHKRGIGNEHDIVGRYFMEHPHMRTGVIVPTDPEGIAGFPVQGIRRLNGHLVEGRLALSQPVLREEGLLNSAVALAPILSDGDFRKSNVRRSTSQAVMSARMLRSAVRRRRLPTDFLRHVLNVVSGLDEVARAATTKASPGVAERLRGRLGRESFRRTANPVALGVDVMSEQAPNPDSRVSLSDRMDRLGVPRVRLNLALTSLDLRTLARTQQLVQEEVEATGLGKAHATFDAEHPPGRVTGGHHHMGTTRMHSDPRNGVVDENCRVHGVANLFVAGSSVFTTGGCANPTLTIVALAVRLADHIASKIFDDSVRTAAGEPRSGH